MGKCVNLRPSHRRGATPSESPGRALAGSPRGPRGTWRAGAGASRRWGRGVAWDPAEGSRQPGIRLSRLRVRKLDPGATSARRSEGEPDGCGSRAPSAGPRPVPSHLWSACDTSVGILLPPQPPTSSASRPLRPSAAALLPLRRRSGSARPPAPPPWASPGECRASAPLPPPLPALSFPRSGSRPAPGCPCAPAVPLSPRCLAAGPRRAGAAGGGAAAGKEAAARAHGVQSRRRQEESVLLL